MEKCVEAKWIEFNKVEPPLHSPSAKTFLYHVQVKGDIPAVIGEVKWFTRWRKYCFFPDSDTVYEQDCLRDIAGFCEQLTDEHRQSLAAAKGANSEQQRSN